MCALVTDGTVHPITAYQQNIVVTNLNLHHSRSQEQHSQKSWILHSVCASTQKHMTQNTFTAMKTNLMQAVVIQINKYANT